MGWLFKYETESKEKRNLFIFITPHIIENPTEAKAIYEGKKSRNRYAGRRGDQVVAAQEGGQLKYMAEAADSKNTGELLDALIEEAKELRRDHGGGVAEALACAHESLRG